MVSETDNTRLVPDNTVTTPLRRDLLAEIPTAGVSTSSTNGGIGPSDGQIVQNSGCTDVEIAHRFRETFRISGYNTKPAHVSRHRSPCRDRRRAVAVRHALPPSSVRVSWRSAVRSTEIPASAGMTKARMDSTTGASRSLVARKEPSPRPNSPQLTRRTVLGRVSTARPAVPAPGLRKGTGEPCQLSTGHQRQLTGTSTSH